LLAGNLARDQIVDLLKTLGKAPQEKAPVPIPQGPATAPHTVIPTTAPAPSKLPGRAVDLSIFSPLALPTDSEHYNVAFELGLFYGHVGALSGLAVSASGVTHVDRDATGLHVNGLGYWHAADTYGLATSGLFGFGSGKLRGVSATGVASVHLGSSSGLQASGLVNIAAGGLLGVQAGGLFNWAGSASLAETKPLGATPKTASESVTGLQAGGLANLAGAPLAGLQAAGVSNVAWAPVTGVQAAGIANVNTGSTTGLQAAGVANVVLADVEGVQVSGVANIAGDLHGAQISVVNIGKHVTGAQIGIVNIATTIKGTQIGVVNVARSVTGASVGIVPYVADGHVRAVAWYDPYSLINLGARFENGPMYAMPTASYAPKSLIARPQGTKPFGFGLVLGARFNLGRAFVDLNGGTFGPNLQASQARYMDLRYRLLVGAHIFDWLGVFAGGGVLHRIKPDAGAEVLLKPVFNAGIELL
jgi:hypothetical protein